MNILIFEDEKHTAKRLANIINKIDHTIKIVGIIGTVAEGIKWFKENESPNLVFQDIILSDGNCFEIYDKIELTVPIIFTTAYSEYAIKSFQVNSIDYIIKPYDTKEIKRAIEKFKELKTSFEAPEKELLKEILSKNAFVPKKRFLVKTGNSYMPIHSIDIAYLESDDGLTFATLFNKEKYIVNISIAELAQQMDPLSFFQINRKIIVNVKSVVKISSWFNSRLKLTLNPSTSEEAIVSRERTSSFKDWMNF